MSENSFEEIYLVSDQIVSVPTEEIDELERKIGSLPVGYREFIHRCGGDGLLMDDITIWPPKTILSEVERERETLTFDKWIRAGSNGNSLVPQDFNDFWVFGHDGIGFTYCYFPRFPGTLFQIVAGGTPIRHERAFAEVDRFWNTNVKHPFPYFTPRDASRRRSRSVQSFGFHSTISQGKLAELIASYWSERELRSTSVQVPAQYEGGESNDTMLFVKEIGCAISISRDEKNYPGQIYGSFNSDPEYHGRVKKCLNFIEHRFSA